MLFQTRVAGIHYGHLTTRSVILHCQVGVVHVLLQEVKKADLPGKPTDESLLIEAIEEKAAPDVVFLRARALLHQSQVTGGVFTAGSHAVPASMHPRGRQEGGSTLDGGVCVQHPIRQPCREVLQARFTEGLFLLPFAQVQHQHQADAEHKPRTRTLSDHLGAPILTVLRLQSFPKGREKTREAKRDCVQVHAVPGREGAGARPRLRSGLRLAPREPARCDPRAPHPQPVLSAPPGRSPPEPLLGAGCPRRPAVRSPLRCAFSRVQRRQRLGEHRKWKLTPWESGKKKKNQVTPLHAELRKRKGRRDRLIRSPTPLGAEPRAILSLPQVRGTAPDEHPTCWMPTTFPC